MDIYDLTIDDLRFIYDLTIYDLAQHLPLGR